jgi:hypothetical protein
VTAREREALVIVLQAPFVLVGVITWVALREVTRGLVWLVGNPGGTQ